MEKQLKHRYISREFFINFIISFLIFSFIFLINGVFKTLEILIKGTLSPYSLFKIMAFFFLTALPYILPLTLLSASISLFSRLTHDREIYIFSFSGINPSTLTKNIIFFSLILTIFLIWYNLFLFPSIKYQRRISIYNMRVKNPLSIFHQKSIINDFPGFSIYIGHLSKNFQFKNLSLIEKHNNTTFFVKAKEGEIKYRPSENTIIFIMKNGFIVSHTSSKISKLDFKEYKFPLKLPENFSTKNPPKKIKELTLKELRNKKDIDSNVEINKRILFGITPLIFVFLGSGIGIRLKSKSKVLNIGVAGVVSLLFFSLLMLGEIISKKIGFAGFVYLPVLIFLIMSYYFLKWLR